jgi:flagellar hook protein FlgE
LHEAGSGGAGSINGSALESSTTDTNEEFSNMIAAQQAYSASAQVITAVNKMYDTLISAVR